MLEKQYEDLVRDKRVAVIGGAPHYVSVDSDLKVFTNTHWEPNQGRMDILYSACPSEPEKALKAQPKFVWLDAHQPGFYFWRTECKKRNIPFGLYKRLYRKKGYEDIETFDWLSDWQKEYDFIPLTGILSVRHLTMYPVAQIYVTGMDFYSVNGKIPDWRGPFQMIKQMKALYDMSFEDQRVVLDPQISKILDNQRD